MLPCMYQVAALFVSSYKKPAAAVSVTSYRLYLIKEALCSKALHEQCWICLAAEEAGVPTDPSLGNQVIKQTKLVGK